jgi:hypothetical protein
LSIIVSVVRHRAFAAALVEFGLSRERLDTSDASEMTSLQSQGREAVKRQLIDVLFRRLDQNAVVVERRRGSAARTSVTT